MTTVQIKPNVRVGTQPGRDNLVRCLRRQAADRPDAVAFANLTDGETSQPPMTYARLDRRARAIGSYLQDRRLTGQRVILAYPPGLDFVSAFFGSLYAGCIAVPTYQPKVRTLDRFHAMADDAGAAVAISTTGAIGQVSAMTNVAGEISWLATDEIDDARAECWQDFEPPTHSLAMIQYTSGSTSQPKGVMLSHANLFNNACAISRSFEIQPDTTCVFWLPTYHDMGLIGGVLLPVFSATTSIVMAPTTFLQNPFRWLDAISKSRAGISGGPNFAYDLCVRKITAEQRATLDLSCWSLAFIGAEAVQSDTLARFAEAFAPCGFKREAFFPCYGLAEATLMVTGPRFGAGAAVQAFDQDALAQDRVEPLPSDAPRARKLVGCGEPVGTLQVAIVDTQSGSPVSTDRIGEIWITGNSISQGYWPEPRKSGTTFQARINNADDVPYLRTGDLGFVYQSQLYITGRMDDLIIVRGRNHHPEDIEATVSRCHTLLEGGLGAIFAVMVEGEQRLVLVQEVQRRDVETLMSILTAIRSAVSDEHGLSLDEVLLIRRGTIPKTSSGKIQRNATRDAFSNGKFNVLAEYRAPGDDNPDVSPVSIRAFDVIAHHAKAMAGPNVANFTPETPLSELYMDSLQSMEFVAALDKSFGRHLPDTIYQQATTLGELAASVEALTGDPLALGADMAEVPEANHVLTQFPEYIEFKNHERAMLAVIGKSPYYRVDQGRGMLPLSRRQATVAGGTVRIDGRDLTNFCAYDYVGMANDPVVIAATKAAIDRYGTGSGASRMVSGEKQVHGDLEHALAAFLGTPAAMAFVSGHATNVTTIGHLMGPGDLVLHDALAHNSILQGGRLSGSVCRAFPHNDWTSLDTMLTESRQRFRRVLIAIEGVYSMDGDHPDLAAFVAVKRKHRAMLLVDEAHSLGTMGPTGRGIGEHANVVRSDVDMWMGTLSKSLASCGGYIAGSAELIAYLKHTTPGFVYSVGLSPPNAAAALAALTLLRREPQRVLRLQKLSNLFVTLAREAGINTGLADGSPVIPVIVGRSDKCLLLSEALFQRGINVQPILHPAVAEHATRLRFFVTCHHTETQIRSTVAMIARELAGL